MGRLASLGLLVEPTESTYAGIVLGWRYLGAFVVAGLVGGLAACTAEAEFVPDTTQQQQVDASMSPAPSGMGMGMGMPTEPFPDASLDDPASIPVEPPLPQDADADGGACSPVASNDDDCDTCLADECTAAFEACNSGGDRCSCGTWAGVIGQGSCLFQCDRLRPWGPDLEACLTECGGDKVSDRTRALVQCAGSFIDGFPHCARCFVAPPGGP